MGMDDQDVAIEGSLGNSHWAAASMFGKSELPPPNHNVSIKDQLDQVQRIWGLEVAHTRLALRVNKLETSAQECATRKEVREGLEAAVKVLEEKLYDPMQGDFASLFHKFRDLEQAHTTLVTRVSELQGRLNKLEAPAKAEPACESCGYRVGHYWHGLRKILCRRCAEESDYARAHPWRVRARRAGDVALLVGAVAVPFGALVFALLRMV